MYTIRSRSLWFVLFCAVLFPAYGEEFVYKYHAGDTYRIISTVKEDVYMDYMPSHSAEILNRIAVKVTDAKDGSGTLDAVFQTSEKAVKTGAVNAGAASPSTFQWSREYKSVFKRDALGRLDVDRQYYMPTVRNVPVFPGKDLKTGEKWSADGYEMHDFRDGFGIQEPYRIPFTADYVFLGAKEWEGKSYPAFSVSYRILSEPEAVRGRIWPTRIMGASDQVVYWDSESGQPAAYTERFRMVFDLSTGNTVEYRGTAEARIIESEKMDKGHDADEIAEDIEKLKIEGTKVRIDDEGVTISLEDVQFLADSAVLRADEKAKLDKVAEILSRYPDRDIMVAGHTALAGTASAREKLSLERAAAVAEYLIGKKVRAPDRIVVRGYGAEQPVGPNTTEEGRRRNRRVEITILEN